MKLLVSQFVRPDEFVPNHREGTTTKHEFKENNRRAASIYTVFEGQEDIPFWKREDGYHFVFTNLTFEAAMAETRREEPYLAHSASETDWSEFMTCYREAYEHHINPRKT